ncbi:protein cornichon homolog 1-like [Mercurialis annua]|uniref:protein cornichon homolog 1-like n=1 Tax=Mercurialis annua TaxID=3986 RepID=UPI00215ED290|nr:protein cornichon homolog 1-like [Mercurialis annua]
MSSHANDGRIKLFGTYNTQVLLECPEPVPSKFLQLLCLTDLEVDHMNSFEATSVVNVWILPEFVLQGVVCILFLLSRHWFLFLFFLPLTCYHLMKFKFLLIYQWSMAMVYFILEG